MENRYTILGILLFCAVLSVAGSAAEQNLPSGGPGGMTPPDGMPPGGTPPDASQGGAPGGGPGGAPPGNQGAASYNLSGAYTVDGTTESRSEATFTSDRTDVSAIYVTNSGKLTLENPTIITSGNTTSNDASSFYGLNGAVLVNNGSVVSITGGSITTSGTGANGVIPTGTGTTVTLADLSITASGDGGHGVMATLDGTLHLSNVSIITRGANGAPLATDRGSGTVTVDGGTITSSGRDSPGIYSTGTISVNDAKISSTGTEAAVIEGFNSINLQNTTLSGGVEKTGGVMIYQSFSGDAETGTGVFTMNGGSLSGVEGPLFFVTNTDAIINLKDVQVKSASDILVNASGTSRWGTAGKNGGIVNLTADNEKLAGSLKTDTISTITASLKNGTELSGAINKASLQIDATSSWNVTGDSVLGGLVDPDGITETSITNIHGNGFTVSYDTNLPANAGLNGKTYTLENGGVLRPATGN